MFSTYLEQSAKHTVWAREQPVAKTVAPRLSTYFHLKIPFVVEELYCGILFQIILMTLVALINFI